MARVAKKEWQLIKRDLVYLSALLIPLIVAIVAVIVLGVQQAHEQRAAVAGELLAPVANYSPVIMVLAVFIVVYLIFLVLMFYDDFHELFVRLEHKRVHRAGPSAFLLSVPVLVCIGALFYIRFVRVVPVSEELLSPFQARPSVLFTGILILMVLYMVAAAFIIIRMRFQK